MRNISTRINSLIGPLTGSFVGYATAPETRNDAASEGIVSAITRYLLENEIVNTVIASKLRVINGHFIPDVILATKPEDLLECKNSTYIYYHIGSKGHFSEIIKLMQQGKRVAVVGLYCHLNSLIRVMEINYIPLDRCIKIGLFCSHAPDVKLIYGLLDKLKIPTENIISFQAKSDKKGINGKLSSTSKTTFTDGSEIFIPYIKFSLYKNAWFFSRNHCLSCPDQFAENADFSCGDAWYKEIRSSLYKQTTILTRNPEAYQILIDMVKEDKILIRNIDPQSVIHSQLTVTGVAKKALPARTYMARFFGI